MTTQRLTLTEWLPDQPSVLNTLQDVSSLIPLPKGYFPFPLAVDYSNAAGTTLNKTYAGKINDTIQIFAGSSTKLYKYNGTTKALDDVSKSGGYNGLDSWKFIQYGSALLAANNHEKLQAWYLGVSTAWADVASTAPVARFVTTVRDFVVAGYLDGGTNANKVQWSDLNDETNWTPSVTSQSDYQIMADGGNITGLTGGQFGIVLLEKAIYRMSYIGSPLFFQFDAISRGLGCVDGNSVAQYRDITYFLSADGFYMCDGQTITPIGVEKVDRWFYKNADPTQFATMTTAVDPIKKLVIWNFADVFGGRTMLVYNFLVQKWSRIETDATTISTIVTQGTTLESLDAYGNMDTLTTSLDDRLWSGGKFLFAGTRGNKIVTFTGSNSPANITIGDWETGYNAVITLIRPQIEDGGATVNISSRKNLGDNIVFGSSSASDSLGRCSVRSAGRYHQIKITPTGNWTSLVSIDVETKDQGQR
jgi:hypothetical protein